MPIGDLNPGAIYGKNTSSRSLSAATGAVSLKEGLMTGGVTAGVSMALGGSVGGSLAAGAAAGGLAATAAIPAAVLIAARKNFEALVSVSTQLVDRYKDASAKMQGISNALDKHKAAIDRQWAKELAPALKRTLDFQMEREKKQTQLDLERHRAWAPFREAQERFSQKLVTLGDKVTAAWSTFVTNMIKSAATLAEKIGLINKPAPDSTKVGNKIQWSANVLKPIRNKDDEKWLPSMEMPSIDKNQEQLDSLVSSANDTYRRSADSSKSRKLIEQRRVYEEKKQKGELPKEPTGGSTGTIGGAMGYFAGQETWRETNKPKSAKASPTPTATISEEPVAKESKVAEIKGAEAVKTNASGPPPVHQAPPVTIQVINKFDDSTKLRDAMMKTYEASIIAVRKAENEAMTNSLRVGRGY